MSPETPSNIGVSVNSHYGYDIVTFVKDSKLSSSIQYLNHRANMSNRYVRELLGLIAAEELGHMEIISVAINKLGGPPLTCVNSQGAPWVINYIDQSFDPIGMLEVDVQAETRTRNLY